MTASRKVTVNLLSWYRAGIGVYFIDHEGEDPPSDLEVFRNDALYARDLAISNGELDDLRAMIDFVIADPSYLTRTFDLTLAELVNDENSQAEEYLAEVLKFYRTAIWPDAEPVVVGHPPDITPVKVALEEWRRTVKQP
jgi:hypothetical protein